MKLSSLLTLFALALTLGLTSCKDKAADTTTTTEGTETTATSGEMTTGEPGVLSSTNPNGEKHYKCTKAGCEGGGDAAGKCPVCGSDLAHNPAFHAQAAANGTTAPTDAIQIDPKTGATSGNNPTVTQTAPPTPPAEKNAKGVYHYTCSKAGCGGGAGAAGKCPKCGGDLAHNAEFHK